MTLAANDQKNHSIARPSKGDYTVIVWEDYRNGTDADIYAQVIDNTNGITQWFPIDGVPVCTASGEQRNPRAAYDSLDGVIITWEDSRSDLTTPYDPATNYTKIYAARLDLATGYQDQNWGGAPVAVCSIPYSHTRNPRIVGFGGGAMITWTDYRDILSTGTDIYAQYILSSTGSYPSGLNWEADGSRVNLDDIEEDQRNPEIVRDSVYVNGVMGAVIAYESEIDEVYEIKLDRLMYDGDNPWGSDFTVTTLSPSYHQYHPRLATLIGNGNTGDTATVIIVWEDYRNYNSQRINIWAQRFDIENHLRRWPPGNVPKIGVPVCSADQDQTNPKIDVGEGFATVAWEDWRTEQDLDIYGNRLEAIYGESISPNGEEICTEAEDQVNVEIEYGPDENGDGRATFCWEDYRPVDVSDVYVQEIDPETWYFYWPTNGQAVTEAKENQLRPEVGHRVFVYTDERRVEITNDTQEDANIYAQRIGDVCDEPTKMHWKDVLAEWTPNVSAQDHRFTADEEGNTYVVWYEDRTISTYQITQPGVYIQKLDKDGVPRWGNDGILLSDSTMPSASPDVCIDGDGGAIATWYKTDNGTDYVVASRVLYDGTIAWTSVASVSGVNPRIATDEGNGAYIAFETASPDMQICRFNGNGLEVWIERLSPTGNKKYPLIASDRNTGCWVAGRTGGGDIWAAHCVTTGVDARSVNAIFTGLTVESYDLAADKMMNSGNEYAGLLAVSDRAFIYMCRLWRPGGRNLSWAPTVMNDAKFQTAGGVDVFLTHVVLDYDSLAITNGSGGGAIVAWDRESPTSPGNHQHQVVTSDADWKTSGGTIIVTNRYSTGWPITVSVACMEQTTPDIVKEDNRDRMQNGQTLVPQYGYIVWHEYGERTCEYKAVAAQEIDYHLDGAGSPFEPRQWYQYGELVSPHSGSVEQYSPFIHASSGDSAAVYWLDTRTTDPVVVGTQLCSRDGNMSLSRRSMTDDPALLSETTLYQSYPNPVAVNGTTSIGYYLGCEAHVVLKVYDLLGREAAVINQGRLQQGFHSALLSTRGLVPGMYVYALCTEGRALTRQLIIVR